MSRYKISIVEDNPEVLSFLLDVFSQTEDFVIQSFYQDVEEAITLLPKSSVNVVIIEIGTSGKSGIDCIRVVKAQRPDILFMVYTIYDWDNEIFESLKAGASGYLVKDGDKNSIVKAVRELAEGGAPMSPYIARRIIDSFSRGNSKKTSGLELLSKQERLVLKLLSQGLLYKEIAEELYIAIGTVKQHTHRIYKKLQVQNKTEAINKYLGRD